jgi:dTDP-glucose 4,6-dehydratase
MTNLFVTGGAGFIGSAFVKLTLSNNPNCRIINYDALTYAGNLDNLKGIDESRYRFIHGDITNRKQVFESVPQHCDAVINFAAESHVDRSITSADEFVQTNVLGTQVLLDVARERQVPRFVQISTDEVMGSLPAEGYFTEESTLAPNSPYAASKAAAEHLVRAAHHTFGLDTVITRCGNNYGPFQFPEKFMPLALINAMNDEPIPYMATAKMCAIGSSSKITVEHSARLLKKERRVCLQHRCAQRTAKPRSCRVDTRCTRKAALTD